MITLTRRYRFSASHRLHLSSLGETENEELYGKCNNPFGHGHDYVLEVTCTGLVDAVSGLLVQQQLLDRLVSEQVLRAFASRNLNLDVPEFTALVPTTENIAIVISNRLDVAWRKAFGDQLQLTRVHIQETDRNGFELHLPAGRQVTQRELLAEMNVHG